MLKHMDIRLETIIRSIIAQHKNGEHMVFKGNRVDLDKACPGDLYKLGQEYAQLADPQAYEIGIALLQIFDSRYDQILNDSTLSEKARDDILFSISSKRLLMGVDKRVHEIAKAYATTSNDVW